jgi:hypothetical protein
MLNLVLLLIFLIVAAAAWVQGLWNSIITLINMLLAMMLAFNYFEPLADMIDEQDASYTYLVDFLVLWGLFVVAFGLLRIMTDVLSRKRVAFEFWTETVGRSIVAVWVAWLFVGFFCASLHTAPLPRSPLGFQPTPTAGNFLGMAPGRQWLGFMQSRSRGALSRPESDQANLSPLPEDENLKVRVFDPESRFILKYYQRRSDFEGEPDYRVAR